MFINRFDFKEGYSQQVYMLNFIKKFVNKNKAEHIYPVNDKIIIKQFDKFKTPFSFDNGASVCFDEASVDFSKLLLSVRGWIAIPKDSDFSIEESENFQITKRKDVESLYPSYMCCGFLGSVPFNSKGASFQVGTLNFKVKNSAIINLIAPYPTLQDVDSLDPLWMSFHNGPSYKRKDQDTLPKPIAFYHQNIGLEKEIESLQDAWNHVKSFNKTEMNYDIDKFGIEHGYDFKSENILKYQVELANFYGLYGWAFICSNSDINKNSLSQVNNFIKDESLNLNFCILLNEKIADVNNLDLYFKDRRYIHVNNKPLIIIAGNDPEITEGSLGDYINNLYIIRIENNLYKTTSADAYIVNPNSQTRIFNLVDRSSKYTDYINTYESSVFDYQEYSHKCIHKYDKTKYQIVPIDRKLNDLESGGFQFVNSNPNQFREVLQTASEYAYENFESNYNFVFIDSWNDWFHNSKLEPDCNYGYGYLHALKDAMEFEYKKRAVIILNEDDSHKDIEVLLDVCFQLHTNFKYKLICVAEKNVSMQFKYDNLFAETLKIEDLDDAKIYELCNDYNIKSIISVDRDFVKANNVHVNSKRVKESTNLIDFVYDVSDKLGFKYEKVSVAIPNYKYVDYLHSRIESVLYQTYPVYEILFMDDASNDGCEKIFDEYIENYPFLFKKFMNTENSGSGYKQWQKAFTLAKGDFLWIAEADDFSKRRFLEKNMRIYVQDKEIDLVWSRSCLINKDRECFLSSWYPSAFETPKGINTKHWENDYICSGYSEILHNLTIRNTVLNVSSVIFKIKDKDYYKILEEVASFKVSGDWYLYVSILSQGGKIGHSSDNLNCYTLHEDSASMSNCNMGHFKEIKRVQVYAASFCKENDIPVELVKAERNAIVSAWNLRNWV